MKMSDLAKLAGVSKSTISRALADNERVKKDTRDRIKALAKKHSYRMNVRARNFRLQNIKTIGVLLPSSGSANWLAKDPFILEMLGSISDALEEHGDHELILAKHSNNDPKWIEEFACSHSVEGIIVVGQSLYHEQLNILAKWQKSLVVWGAIIEGQKYCTVGSDNYHGGLIATQSLIAQGRSYIAFVGDIRFPETKLRYSGYCDALHEAGIDNYPDLIIKSEHAIGQLQDSIRKLLIAVPRFDGLVAASDLIAISAMQAITINGLSVPKDVSVIGYDDITLAKYFSPSLSSVAQDRALAGRALVDKLFEIMADGSSSNSMIVTKLIERESSDYP